MSYFKSYVFDGRKTARKIEDSDASYLWIDEGDVAEISVSKRGNYRVHSTWAQNTSNVPGGIGFGALVGGVIGVLFGPLGLIAGAAYGGSVGGLIGASESFAFDDPSLDGVLRLDTADQQAVVKRTNLHMRVVSFRSQSPNEPWGALLPDTSALVIIGDQATIDEFSEALAEYEAKEFVAELDEEAIEALKEQMKKAKK